MILFPRTSNTTHQLVAGEKIRMPVTANNLMFSVIFQQFKIPKPSGQAGNITFRRKRFATSSTHITLGPSTQFCNRPNKILVPIHQISIPFFNQRTHRWHMIFRFHVSTSALKYATKTDTTGGIGFWAQGI